MDINIVRVTILTVREFNPNSIELKYDENILKS